MEITITIKMDGNEAKSLTVERKETVEGTKNAVSRYSRSFDETCSAYYKNQRSNYIFLKHVQAWVNDVLRAKGYIFLNEVYDALGMSRTEIGQLVGWVYDKENPFGDNFVDFGLGTENLDQFIMEHPDSILLDFNVDGFILDKVKKTEL